MDGLNESASSRAVAAFLAGKHRLLIDGKWVDARSAKTFSSRNPATGEILAEVAEGDAADIDAGPERAGEPAPARSGTLVVLAGAQRL